MVETWMETILERTEFIGSPIGGLRGVVVGREGEKRRNKKMFCRRNQSLEGLRLWSYFNLYVLKVS